MNYQFDYQMKNPLAWREDYVVSLSDNPVHLGGLFPAAYGIGFWADDLRARRGRLSAMKRASCRSDVPQRLHSALQHLLCGEISQSVLGSLHALQEWQDSEEWDGSQEPRAVRELRELVEALEEILGLDSRRLRARKKRLFWLKPAQVALMSRFFPTCRGNPRVDDLRVLSGIIFVMMTGCRWCDAPEEYGSPKTLYSRFKRWSDKGIFRKMLQGMPAVRKELEKRGEADVRKRRGRKRKRIIVMMDSVFCKAHRTSCSMALRVGKDGRQIGLTKGGQNSKLHVVCDDFFRLIDIHLTAGNVSDYKGAQVLLDRLCEAHVLLADRGYDANWIRDLLKSLGVKCCIPSKKNRKKHIRHNKKLYKKRHKIENCFARLKDWRRVATRYDRCPKAYLSTCALAAVVMFWL